jgi:hypothetical protein
MDLKTALRWAEGFLVVLIVNLFSLVTIGGQPLDVTSNEGRAAAFGALMSAVVLAFRRAWAVHNLPTGPIGG